MNIQQRPDDALYGEYKAVCNHCGWSMKFTQSLSCGLTPGDIVFKDPESPALGHCVRCKRSMMKVTEVPQLPPIPSPKGFWKVPTE